MPERLRGFRDFYPEDQEIRRVIFNIMKSECRNFGFREVEGPSLESVELYAHKSGEEIMNQMFSFTDKGGREIALVPEFTPTLARMVASRKDLTKPLKWYTLAKFWRYEEPQSGRYREFYQLNADILGSESIYADSEILNLAGSIMVSLGLGNKVKIKVNSRSLLDDIFSLKTNMRRDDLFYILDRWNKTSIEERNKIILDLGLDFDFVESIANNKILNEIRSDNLNKLYEIVDLVKEYGSIPIEIDLKIVRGLAYYTSTVFEIWDSEEKMRAIMGGGRYDNIVSQMNGEFTPAVGFGMGDAVIENIMKREGLWTEKPEKKVFVAIADEKGRAYSYGISKKLRASGVPADINVTYRGIGRQMEYAAKMGYRYAIILGEKEAKGSIVSLKDLITGEQKSLSFEEALNQIRNT